MVYKNELNKYFGIVVDGYTLNGHFVLAQTVISV